MAGYVSDAVIRRLPGYYRHLRELEQEGVTQISSQGLGERMKLTASQIRQDINCFGGFGRQGYGYPVVELRQQIGAILGVNRSHAMLIIGAGNIGRAIARSETFPKDGFFTTAVFDNDPKKIGMTLESLTVKDVETLKDYLAGHTVEVAVLAVPATAAQRVAERVYEVGIRGLWNFASVDLKLPQDMAVVNVHLSDSLQTLSFRLDQMRGA